MSDAPPDDMDEDKKQQTPTNVFEKSTGDFDFLENFGGNTSTTPEINFSGFEKQNSNPSSFGFDNSNQFENNPFDNSFGKKANLQDSSTSKANAQLDPFSDFNSKPVSTNNTQNSFSTNQFSNKSVTEKPNPIKKLGNPFSSTNSEPQKPTQNQTSFDPFQFTANDQSKGNSNQGGLTNVNFGSYSNTFSNTKPQSKSAWDIDLDSELDINKNNQFSNNFGSQNNSNNLSDFKFGASTSSNSKSSNPWDSLDDEIQKPSLIQQPSNTGFGQSNNFQSDFGKNQNDPFNSNNFGSKQQQGGSGGMVINQSSKNNPFAIKEDDFLANVQGNKPKNNAFNFIGKPQTFNSSGNDLI